jgi:hypothetical protein
VGARHNDHVQSIVLLHWEGDENGGMDRLADAPQAELVSSALSIALNARGFGLHAPHPRRAL